MKTTPTTPKTAVNMRISCLSVGMSPKPTVVRVTAAKYMQSMKSQLHPNVSQLADDLRASQPGLGRLSHSPPLSGE